MVRADSLGLRMSQYLIDQIGSTSNIETLVESRVIEVGGKDRLESVRIEDLSTEEAAEHPHNIARKTFVEVDGVPQPAPALRFSRTRPEIQCPPAAPGEHTEATLAQWGFSKAEIESLAAAGAI